MRNTKTILIVLLGLLLSYSINAQNAGFLNQLRIGFGGGVNFAQIIDLEPYNIYEDLSGASYTNEYSIMFQNIGNQYFVQVEWFNDFLIVALKPGTYTYRFSKLNEVVFTNETVEQETPYLLRYFTIPLEVRYRIDLQRFRPYAGGSISYSNLLGSLDASNQTFISPKFTAGAVAGSYIDLRYVILDLNVGYHMGLHNITNKADRYETGSGETFAQNDIMLNDLQFNLSILFSLSKQKHYSNVECFY
ncbi:MAG: hypothetical protein U9R49_03795 [Bacteroidota bacterium]|nr:hypothetical protein [Bacteroidota bacterium]